MTESLGIQVSSITATETRGLIQEVLGGADVLLQGGQGKKVCKWDQCQQK